MKKTLVAPRRDLRLELLEKKKSTPRNINGQSMSIQKNISLHADKHEKPTGHSFQGRYRNKNLASLTAPLLVTLSTLTTLDISYNQLNDSQIQLVMNSCTKITTLCIQGNINSIIPASIWKLKQLTNFRHDWLKINSEKQQTFEPEEHLLKIKRVVQKPELVMKIGRVVGLDFQIYCKEIAHIGLDNVLAEKIQKSSCSTFAKQIMLKAVKQAQQTLAKQKGKVKPIMEKQQFLIVCTAMCGFNQTARQRQPKPSMLRKKEPHTNSGKDLSQAETDCDSHKIKIQDIRDISEKESSIIINDKILTYSAPGFPLHELFAHFDSNPRSPSEIDGLLIRGYNPNQYDMNGLSPYHVCAIQNQKIGFQYLLQISANNPGFFDLEMPSQKEGRNILHFCVFLKNYNFTKQLMEFGFPLGQRDANGARIVHLVDQNYQFMLLLRKMFKKISQTSRNRNSLTIPTSFKKKYVKHPQRLKQQSKFRIMYNKNDKLMDMYETAVGFNEGRRY